jgi:hypothetical protein
MFIFSMGKFTLSTWIVRPSREPQLNLRQKKWEPPSLPAKNFAGRIPSSEQCETTLCP